MKENEQKQEVKEKIRISERKILKGQKWGERIFERQIVLERKREKRGKWRERAREH